MMVELNEVDPVFLRAASARLGLRNLPQVLALRHTVTVTDDAREHHGLDPWVQWVGVHSGVPSTVHGVIRLGDTSSQSRPQIWHALARAGYTWGVWGPMNAPLGDTTGCAFFMPDPWSYDEMAYPTELNDVLALPRYVSKNYLEIDRIEAFRLACRFVRFAIRPRNAGTAARFAVAAARAILRTGANVHTCTTLLDYLSVLLFVKLRRRHQPNLSLIFLNHIAHLQHQFWLPGERIHPEMELGLRLCDEMIGMLLSDRAPGEALVVMNAFKQTNVAGTGVCGYRQRNPATALQSLGIEGARVEQCMTNDAHIFLATSEKADQAEAILQSCVLPDGSKVFHLERRGATVIFYQVDFEHRIAPGTMLTTTDRTIAFDDVFEFVAERTGAHVRGGDIYADGIELPGDMHNHEIFDAIASHFGVAQDRLPTLITEPQRLPVGA